MNSTMGESASSAIWQTKPREVADTPECFTAIQRDLHRLEKQVDRNVMTLNTEKHQVHHPGRNNFRHQSRLEVSWLESSMAEKDPAVLVDRLAMSQQRALTAKEASSFLAALGRASPASRGR